MSYVSGDVAIGNFEPDEDGFSRVWLPDIEEPVEIGHIASVCDDECHGLARVVKFDGDAVMESALAPEGAHRRRGGEGRRGTGAHRGRLVRLPRTNDALTREIGV